MTTLSLGSGLVNKITQKVFSDNTYISGTSSNGNTRSSLTATNIGMGGAGYGTATGNYTGQYYAQTPTALPSYFSLMKGVVPSAIADVSSNQRSSDELVRFTGPNPNSNLGNGSYSYQITTSADTSLAYNSVTPNDFIIVIDGKTATWSALNLSFLPRYPLTSGTPTWFWFRTGGLEHNIIGTVGATGSGSDLELQTYEYIDASKEYTLYNATMAVFEMTQDINY